MNLFQKKYPETKEYFKNNEWRKNNLSNVQKDEYRKKFDKMIIDYAQENKDKNFIYEGSDLFCKSDIGLMVGKPLIVKRTSALLLLFEVLKEVIMIVILLNKKLII